MKRRYDRILALLVLLAACTVFLNACGAGETSEVGAMEEPLAAKEETLPQEENPEEQPLTLEELLGEDYVSYLTETITMQMGNRMDKNPEVRYFPIEDDAPLSDYVAIDETTKF